jgi:hypothetical protein
MKMTLDPESARIVRFGVTCLRHTEDHQSGEGIAITLYIPVESYWVVTVCQRGEVGLAKTERGVSIDDEIAR